MRWADLVLNYLQTLAWPGVVIASIWIFRVQLRKLIVNVSRVSAFGAEAEFQELKSEVEVTGQEIGSLAIQTISTSSEKVMNSTGISGPVGIEEADEEKALAKELSRVDFTDIDLTDLASAATEASKRLNSALTRIMQHFGIPLFMSPETTGKAIERATRNSDWPLIVRWADEFTSSAAAMADVGKEVKKLKSADVSSEFDKTVRGLLSNIYEAASLLPSVVETSLRNTRED